MRPHSREHVWSTPAEQRVALDVDGVLLDFLGRWRERMEELFGERPEQTGAYSLSERFHLCDHEVEAVWRRFSDRRDWGTLSLLPGAREWVEQARESGLVTFALTQLPRGLVPERERNLREHGIGMPVVSRPEGDKAEALATDARARFFVDDHIDHINRAREHLGAAIDLTHVQAVDCSAIMADRVVPGLGAFSARELFVDIEPMASDEVLPSP